MFSHVPFVATSGPACGGANCGLVARRASGAVRANELGLFQHPSATQLPPPSPRACCDTNAAPCGLDASCAQPAAYEAARLYGFLGQLNVADDIVLARLVRATAGYGIGAATSAATGAAPVGFLAFLSTADAILAAVALTTTLPATGNVSAMTAPRAIVVRPVPGGGSLAIIVGTGTLTDASGAVISEGQPALATVPVCGCVLGAPTVFIGNAITASYTTLDYYDVALNPCDCATVYVCGALTNVDEDDRYPIVLLVQLDTGVTTTWSMLPALAYAGTAVSLALTPRLVNVAVNNLAGTAVTVWSLTPIYLDSVAPEPAVATTQYNDPSTSAIALPTTLAGAVAVRLLADAAGCLYVVCRVAFLDGIGPAAGLGVWAFDADTAPVLSYGVFGVFTWALADGGATTSSQPTDALLLPDGTVVIGGNGYANGAFTYEYPTLPFLTAPDVDYPRPFLLTLSGSCAATRCAPSTACVPRTPCVAVLWSALTGCAQARLQNAVYVSNPKTVHGVGDVFGHVTCPAEPAGVLHTITAVTCPARLLNCGPAPPSAAWEPFTTPPSDGGPVRVDYCCGGTSTLVVAGPVVVGGTCAGGAPLPIPGSIVFDAPTGTLQLYTGTEWRTLAFAFD